MKKVLLFPVLFLTIFLAACTVPTKVFLFNSSGQDIVVKYVDEYQKPVTEIVRVGEKIESMMLLEAEFTIQSNLAVSKYSPDGFPQEFVENTGFGPFISRIVKAQLENDGCIYLIPKKSQLPAQDHGVQPAGFPLCPTSTSKAQRG